MATFVLVHGAFRGGWAWRRVRRHLSAAGHDVYAPSLLGAGELAPQIGAVTGLDVWVDQVAALIELEDLDDVILVGHSQGGLVTTSVAARIPERIAALVHLDAAVPEPGWRAVDLTPGGAPATLPPRTAVVPPSPVLEAEHGGEHNAVTAAWLAARTTPSPVAVALDPVPAVPAEVPEHFVFFTDTPAGYPAGVVRARLASASHPFRLIDAGHDAPLSDPIVVAALLLELAEAPHASPHAQRKDPTE
ncbi:alpha/beta fold hydrolase [Nocardioides sp.]|uniref:alpha/beta fold hydrolase n=1 Tax=Nocardioides sp. TaxID=35761 RepID=UPI002638DFCB|nr:alpha/beta fold hydrolase [Nocardioides sp.]